MLRCQTPRWRSISSNTRETIIMGRSSSIFKIERYLQKIMAPMTCRINMDWNDTQPLCTQSYFSYEDLLTSISLQNQTHNSKIKRIQQMQMTFPQFNSKLEWISLKKFKRFGHKSHHSKENRIIGNLKKPENGDHIIDTKAIKNLTLI